MYADRSKKRITLFGSQLQEPLASGQSTRETQDQVGSRPPQRGCHAVVRVAAALTGRDVRDPPHGATALPRRFPGGLLRTCD
jgi:hypothetical protein